MRLEAIVFSSGNQRYERLAAVLSKSAAQNSPDTPLTIHEITEPDDDVIRHTRPDCERIFVNNCRKAKHHARIIHEAADGEVLGMLDADTMVLADLSEVEQLDFDLAYTIRPKPQHPLHPWKINTGVYFIRASAALREFVESWYDLALRMLKDKALHDFWCNKKYYGGIHQASLGCLLETGLRIRTIELPCEVWNMVNGTWGMNDNPKVVHIMASLRDWCLSNCRRERPHEQRLIDQWKAFERPAHACV